MLSRGYVSAQAVVSLEVPRQPPLHPLLRPVRLEYRHLLEAHRRLVAQESDLKGHCIEFKYYADGIHSGLT